MISTAFDPFPMPQDFNPGPSLIWLMLGLGAFIFVFMATGIYLVALAEYRKMRTKQQEEHSGNVSGAGPASGKVKPGNRKLGAYRDEIWMADDFDAPLPPEILAGFLGEEIKQKAPSKK